MGVAEMGVVTMIKLAGYYLYSRTDLVRFERFSVLEITFLVNVYRCHKILGPPIFRPPRA